jgi:NADH-quinone oxidoreductase subunit L
LGLGAFSAAVFHLTTHAFFKALLFLGAGSVIHAMGGEQDIRKMGGLRKKMPMTYFTFLAGTLAISGILPFSGFFSKDLILSKAFEQNVWLYVPALAGALLTCFYMFRLLYLVFFGNQRLAAAHPHESPGVMTVPLIILAYLSIFGGFLSIPSILGGKSNFTSFLDIAVFSKVSGEISPIVDAGLILLSLGLLILIIGWAYRIYVKKAMIPADDQEPSSSINKLVYNKFYFDEVYSFLFEKPFGFLSDFLFKKVEAPVLDKFIDLIGDVVSRSGTLVRRIQRGNMSFYLFAMVAGILLFMIFILTI